MSAGLKVQGLVSGYGETVVLDGISFEMPAGGTLAVLGRNGVGKTTLLTTLMGITTRHGGTIHLGDQSIETTSIYRRARLGLGYVPQEREIFTSLTVEENIAVSQLPGGWSIDKVYELFPRLKERRRNTGNRLSGGEQQMLAVSRAMMSRPRLLLCDEPSLGLSPKLVGELFASLEAINKEWDMGMLIVEQNAAIALSIATRGYLLEVGSITRSGDAAQLSDSDAVRAAYLGY